MTRAELQKGMGSEVANQGTKNAKAELLAATREWLTLRKSYKTKSDPKEIYL